MMYVRLGVYESMLTVAWMAHRCEQQWGSSVMLPNDLIIDMTETVWEAVWVDIYIYIYIYT